MKTLSSLKANRVLVLVIIYANFTFNFCTLFHYKKKKKKNVLFIVNNGEKNWHTKNVNFTLTSKLS